MEAGGSWEGKVDIVVRGLLKGGMEGGGGETEDEATVMELLPDGGRGLDRPGKHKLFLVRMLFKAAKPSLKATFVLWC